MSPKTFLMRDFDETWPAVRYYFLLEVITVTIKMQNIQESLANANVSTRQQCTYVGPLAKNLRQINTRKLILKSTFSGLQRCRWQQKFIFIRSAIIASQIRKIPRNSPKIRTYNSSRSYKVTELGVNRKRICYFLLVINSIIVTLYVSHTVIEILTFKARKWVDFPSLPSSNQLQFLDKIYPAKLQGCSYRIVKIS